MSNKKVILISREYGSGGRAIGEKLAKDLINNHVMDLMNDQFGTNVYYINQ